MSIYCLFLCVVVIALYPVECTAFEARSGGFRDILELGVGARSLGMGNAVISTVDDATAAFWNPAALTLLDRKQSASAKSFLKMDRRFDFGAAAFPVGKTTIGGYISRFSLDDISVTELNMDQIVGVKPDGTPIYDVSIRDVYSDSMTVIGLSMGAALLPDLSIGGSLKYLRESVFREEAVGFGADMGFLYTPTNDVRIGATLRNLPAKLEWNGSLGSTTKLPVSGTLGISYHYYDSLIVALAIKKTEDVDFVMSAGAEYNYSRKVFLRTGYSDDGITAGFGLKVGDWQVDYAYADRTLYPEHRISSTFRWGGVKRACHEFTNPVLRKLGSSEISGQSGNGAISSNAINSKPSNEAATSARVTVMERKDKTIDSLFVGGNSKPPVRTVIVDSDSASLAPRPVSKEKETRDPSKDSFEKLLSESERVSRDAEDNAKAMEDQKKEIADLFMKTAEDYGSLNESEFYFQSRNIIVDTFDAGDERHVPDKSFEGRRECPARMFTINRQRRRVYVNSIPLEGYSLMESEANEVLVPLKDLAREFDIFYIFRPETQQILLITPSRSLIKANLFSNMISVDGKYRKLSSQITIVDNKVLGPLQVLAAIIRKNY
ncbi:MAG: hypothetical protein CVV64_02625 [Candidatus Wallbacteria bacterium HGW-Wallbacteria-1]|uniref:PorV/PorQ family protein n=1 Tax=Candidatus Wallbacteria bacterium HGW-Wallbacteria-1 TaxID=2013854 RepID=A0A2N1PVG3_9BACT|nr:MAG: hypothetical protein CVV64_02625 [Candidatus Wallbacteria bacterium HGW-Wallbacteria-1]